jgi:ribosome-associated toxin RatA of RatAB toxin-antitoxin module
MRNVAMRLRAPSVDAADAYLLVSDFARYPSMTDTVREVVIEAPSGDGSVVSTWVVRFRKGLLQWTERDVLDPTNNTIAFTQLRGDFHRFDGEWLVSSAEEGGSIVTFNATFDLGMASLEEILDPIAESALRDNIRLIVAGLLGQVEEISAETAAPVSS